MRRLLLATAFASAFCINPASAKVAELPDAKFIDLLHSNLMGEAPDFEEQARYTPAYLNADEFSKSEVLKEQADILRQEYLDIAEYDGLLLRVRAEVGEWDGNKGGFPITLFLPGTYVNTGSGSGYTTGVGFTNHIEARYWTMAVDEARGIADKLGNNRTVDLMVEISNLHIRDEQQHVITGQVDKVTIFNSENVEIGAYEVEPPRVVDASADVGAIARSATELLKVPELGVGLDEAFAWATESFDGVAWRVRNFDAALKYEGTETREYRDFLPNSETVRIAFGPDFDSAKIALNTFNFERNKSDTEFAFGKNFDCRSPEVLDRCGLLLFEKQDGVHRLVETVLLQEVPNGDYQSLIPTLLGDDLAAYSLDENRPIVRYGEGELYYLGSREAGGMKSINFGDHFRDNYVAPIMHYSFAVENNRSAVVSRISALPDKSNVTGE